MFLVSARKWTDTDTLEATLLPTQSWPKYSRFKIQSRFSWARSLSQSTFTNISFLILMSLLPWKFITFSLNFLYRRRLGITLTSEFYSGTNHFYISHTWNCHCSYCAFSYKLSTLTHFDPSDSNLIIHTIIALINEVNMYCDDSTQFRLISWVRGSLEELCI